jgi:hypothetical protein
MTETDRETATASVLSRAILYVPMLAIAKIVCNRIRPLAAIGHFLAG